MEKKLLNYSIFKRYNIFILSLPIILFFFVRTFTILFGIDVVDVGYHLVNQKLFTIMGLKFASIVPWWWFSDVVGGYWLKLSHDCGLWAASFGGTIINVLIVILSLKIISEIYRLHIITVFAIIFAEFVYCPPIYINYINVPILIFLIFVLFFLKSTINPTIYRYQFFSGIALILLIFSRVPMIVCLFFPITALLLCFYMKKNQTKALAVSYLRIFISSSIFFLIVAFLLSMNGVLKDCLFFNIPSDYHTFSRFFNIYLRHDLSKIGYFILLFGISGVFFYFYKKKLKQTIYLFSCLLLISLVGSFFAPKFIGLKNRFFTQICYLSILFGIPTLFHLIFKKFKKRTFFYLFGLIFVMTLFGLRYIPNYQELRYLFFPFYFWDFVAIFFYAILFFIDVACLYFLKDTITFEEIIIFILAAFFPLFFSFGSGLGLSSASHGICLLSGVTYHLICKVGLQFNCKAPIFMLGSILFIFFGFFGIKSAYFPLSDSQHFSRLTTEFSSPRLKNFHTTYKRALSLDSLIKEISKYTKKDDRILAYPFIPMIYYATNTLPYADHAYIVVLQTENLINKMNKFDKNSPPVLIVKSKTNTQNKKWGLKPIYLKDDLSGTLLLHTKLDLLEKKINEMWNLKLVWSNIDFDLYQTSVKE